MTVQSTGLMARYTSGVRNDFLSYFPSSLKMCMSLKQLYVQASTGTLPSWKEGLRNTEEQREGKKLPRCISTRHQQREAWPCFLLLPVGLGPAWIPT